MDIEETFHPKELESLLSDLWDTMRNAPTERWQMPRTTGFQRLVDIRGWRSIIQEQATRYDYIKQHTLSEFHAR